ncbi:nucleoporin NUP188 isoform X2 [Procambarus clarkii]|uniref:nucleoporin NUP188 isoform X1 n=1 Tax=Procambarus clarkii TaxID=6728 RepID=UPI0037448800
MTNVEIVSGKALWGVICGTYVLPSDEVVGAELQLAAPHLGAGLGAYAKPSRDHYEKWSQTAEATQSEKDFVKRLSQLLNLSAAHSWEIFQLFLLYEFRGAEASLAEVLANQRDEENFMAQLWNFYLGDRLHLLRCLRHIVANTANPQHPYQSLFADFMHDVLDKNGTLGESLVEQVLLCTRMVPPNLQTHGPHLPSHGLHTWLANHLAEMRELLATLLVYYGSTSHILTPDTFKKLVQLAQGGGLGGRHEIQEGLRDSHGPLVEALDATHMLLLILAINADSPTSGHSFCNSGWVSKLDPIMAGLGARTPHLAPLLAWAVLQLRANAQSSPAQPKIYHKLAQRALHGNVFGYLQTALNNTAIKGEELLLRLASSVVYSLVCAASGSLDLDRMGCLPVLNSLAKTCLAQDPPAYLFWAEEGGGAGLLLPQALEVFPHNVEPLLSLATALALANPESCHKVVELLSELPNITWVIPESESQNIQIRGDDCFTTAPLHLMPTVTVPEHTSGMLILKNPLVVVWQMPTNAWQALLAIMKLLDNEVSGGASLPDPRLMTAVSATMRLLSSVLTTLPSQLPALIHFVYQSIGLLSRVSQVSRPPGALVAALLGFLSEVATQQPKLVWTELEGSPLLPFLSTSQTAEIKRGKVDPFLGYRAGRLRALVCGEEAATGSYPILCSYTGLLTAAIKGDISSGSVSGGIVFMAREVAGTLLRWCYSSQDERETVLDRCLALLHHTLEGSNMDSSVRDLVVRQLVDRSSAGQTLLSVVVSGASLESALNHPTHSPISTHAHRLTRTAQMALSILHRLVGEESSMSGLSQLLRAAPSLGVTLGGGGRSQGSGSPPHLALTVALYAHQRLNPRLSYLALRTLTRFAQKLDVPLVACFGGEADGIRDALLRRLDSATEDVRVKVALLRLLTASTTRQQGLTNAFLTPPEKLLDPLTSLANPSTRNESGRELALAIVELLDALWSEKYTTATMYLQDKEVFWKALIHPLTTERPGEVSDAVVGHTLKVFARHLFLFPSGHTPSTCLKSAMDQLCNSDTGTICLWSKHITMSLESGSGSNKDVRELLLPAWRDFLVVLVARAKSWLTDHQKVSLASDILHALIHQLELETADEPLTILLAELYLSLVKHCGKQLAEKADVFIKIGKLLMLVQGAVMSTPTHCQLLILGAALRMVTLTEVSQQSQGQVLALLSPVVGLVQQHGRLAGPKTHSCTSAATLGLATSILHQCLLRCNEETAHQHLAHSPVVHALLHAVEIYMKNGEEEVVGELLRLLATLSRISPFSEELSTHALSSTLTLVIPPSKTNLLSEVVWAVVWGVMREGVGGVEGGVNVAAVHLSALCGSLAAPYRQPRLALATAALVTALTPHASLWTVMHPVSHSQLTAATTRCIHLTTHLLCTPRVVQMELSGEKSISSSATSSSISAVSDPSTMSATASITANTTAVLNQMLQVLCACLGAIRSSGPDLTDLLCGPGIDVGAWMLYFHPSFRPVSAYDPNAQPSLASLTSVLDLYDSHASKESRGVSPCRGGAPEVGLCMRVLATCAEQALLLLLTQATLALMSPETPPRDAIRVRHGLADEMNSFFMRWLGRRPVVSPLPSTSTGVSGVSSSVQIDLTYLRLAQQLIGRLGATK